MPNPLMLFLVLILLSFGSAKLYKISTRGISNTANNDEEKDAANSEQFIKVKEDEIFHPKVVTNLSELGEAEDNSLEHGGENSSFAEQDDQDTTEIEHDADNNEDMVK